MQLNDLFHYTTLQIGNPHKLTLWGAIRGSSDDEAALHDRFMQSHVRGEWYELTIDIINNMYEVESQRMCDGELELSYLKAQHANNNAIHER